MKGPLQSPGLARGVPSVTTTVRVTHGRFAPRSARSSTFREFLKADSLLSRRSPALGADELT